jgi:hemoglobin-like flavoprotein
MQMRCNYFDGQHQQHFISVIPDKTVRIQVHPYRYPITQSRLLRLLLDEVNEHLSGCP